MQTALDENLRRFKLSSSSHHHFILPSLVPKSPSLIVKFLWELRIDGKFDWSQEAEHSVFLLLCVSHIFFCESKFFPLINSSSK